jgi:hypothetical protein
MKAQDLSQAIFFFKQTHHSTGTAAGTQTCQLEEAGYDLMVCKNYAIKMTAVMKALENFNSLLFSFIHTSCQLLSSLNLSAFYRYLMETELS